MKTSHPLSPSNCIYQSLSLILYIYPIHYLLSRSLSLALSLSFFNSPSLFLSPTLSLFLSHYLSLYRIHFLWINMFSIQCNVSNFSFNRKYTGGEKHWVMCTYSLTIHAARTKTNMSWDFIAILVALGLCKSFCVIFLTLHVVDTYSKDEVLFPYLIGTPTS